MKPTAATMGHVDWAAKGGRLRKSVTTTRTKLDKSSDPLATRRYFLLAPLMTAFAASGRQTQIRAN